MVDPVLIVTNNKMVVDKAGDRYNIEFVEGTLMDVLRLVRDYVHKGHRILTHPLSGSVKPNETPYKTVLISRANGQTIDMDSLLLIEDSIMTAEKFLKEKGTPDWPDEILSDFRFIDYDLISYVIN